MSEQHEQLVHRATRLLVQCRPAQWAAVGGRQMICRKRHGLGFRCRSGHADLR
jgi:hypothetical protein